MTDYSRPDTDADRTLDVALSRTLPPPRLPAGFRVNLQDALGWIADSHTLETRRRFEREHREKLAQLHHHYVRVQRKTLGTMIGVAFATGAAAAVALPWVTKHLGPEGPAVIASIGAAVGIWMGVSSWLRALGERDSGMQS